MLKNAEGNAELKSLHVDSLVIEHIQVSTAVRSSHTWALPATLRWSFLKKNRLSLNQKRGLPWKNNDLSPGNNCCPPQKKMQIKVFKKEQVADVELYPRSYSSYRLQFCSLLWKNKTRARSSLYLICKNCQGS